MTTDPHLKTIIIGDLHGEWKYLNGLIVRRRPEIILSTGDFGYWPNFDGLKMGIPPRLWTMKKIYNHEVMVYFAPGNHENWWELNKLEDIEIRPNVFYMKRGQVIRLNNKNILFMGGADSIDKKSRYIGHDWFPEEVITQQDIYNLPNIEINVVISHTCPGSFDVGRVNIPSKMGDPSRQALEYILDCYKPQFWYFSHFHYQMSGYDKNCQWYMLNMAPNTNWWRWMDD